MQYSTPKQKIFSSNLEILRGAAALMVVIHHAISLDNYIDPHYNPTIMKSFEPPGHFAVLIFFVLSGYVIGLSNPEALSRDRIVPYLKRRFIRLYPIYFVALTFALITATRHYSVGSMLVNYGIMQNTFGNIVFENVPIWTLNYEVIYYLLFIPFSYLKVRPINVVFVSLMVAIINYIIYPRFNAPIITSYGYGFAFWATGWCLAYYFKAKEVTFDYAKLLSGLFLILGQRVLSFPLYLMDKFIFSKLHTNLSFPERVPIFAKEITVGDLSHIGYCILLVVLFADIKFKYKKAFITILHLMPLALIAQMAIHYKDTIRDGPKLFAILCYIVSMALYYLPSALMERGSKDLLVKLYKFGAISYGIYIIHFPIVMLFREVPYFSGSSVTYAIRFMIYPVLAIMAGYWLDRRFQPVIGGYLKKWMLPATVKKGN
jgi:peptidoglycan/LPS O-acetylase OafA/YrhL